MGWLSFRCNFQISSFKPFLPLLLRIIQDSSTWAFSNNGSFSLKAAYVMAKGLNPLNLCSSPISWVWKIKWNPRIIFFFWLVSHNSIPTFEVLGSRGFTLDSYCPLFMECSESIIHVLRDCKYAKLFWKKLVFPILFSIPFLYLFLIDLKSMLLILFPPITWKYLGRFFFLWEFGIYGCKEMLLFLD